MSDALDPHTSSSCSCVAMRPMQFPQRADLGCCDSRSAALVAIAYHVDFNRELTARVVR